MDIGIRSAGRPKAVAGTRIEQAGLPQVGGRKGRILLGERQPTRGSLLPPPGGRSQPARRV